MVSHGQVSHGQVIMLYPAELLLASFIFSAFVLLFFSHKREIKLVEQTVRTTEADAARHYYMLPSTYQKIQQNNSDAMLEDIQ